MELCKCGCNQHIGPFSKLGYVWGHYVKDYNPMNKEEHRKKLKGINNPNYGKKERYWLDGENNPAKRLEVQEKISKSKIGKKRPDMKLRIREKNPCWKVTSDHSDLLHKLAKKYFYTGYCEMCGMTEEELNYTLHMHYLLEPHDWKIINPNAWICVCGSCHKILENRRLQS